MLFSSTFLLFSSIFLSPFLRLSLAHAEIFKYVSKHLVGSYFANDVAEVVDAFAEILADKVARKVLVEAVDYLLDARKCGRECFIMAEIAHDGFSAVGLCLLLQ